MEHIEFVIDRYQRRWYMPWRLKFVQQETASSYEEMMSCLSRWGWDQSNLFVEDDLISSMTWFNGVVVIPITPNCQ